MNTWMTEQRAELATERILDAAAELFLNRGMAQTTMEDVARAAGCARATVYRYFDDRDALRTAFVHRETRRIGARVAEAVTGIADPGQRVVQAILLAVAEVREQPILSGWFGSDNVDITRDIVSRSPAIHLLAATATNPPGDEVEARWLVRMVMSLIVFPGADAKEERAMLERFVAPLVADQPARPKSSSKRTMSSSPK